MDKIRSLYLECLRISAALYVFIFHIGSGELGNKLYFSTEKFGQSLGLKNLSAHYFVIVFFVLSGFLITMSVSRPNVTLKSFFIARLGRLYSVLLPALLFSYLVSFILVRGHFVPADLIQNNNNLVSRFILNITFLTQTWSLCSTPPLNTPFWSVNYEFIYYMIIAVAFLVKNNKLKLVLFALLALLAWPKVLLLFPAWFAGSLLYFVKDKIMPGKWLAFLLFLVSLFAIGALIANPEWMPLTKDVGDNWFHGFKLLFSWNYQADFLFSILVAGNIYFLFSISAAVLRRVPYNALNSVNNFIRKIGNCSYTLYMFHLPLLFLYVSIFPYDRTNNLHLAVLAISVLATVYFIARYTEWKVEFWRSLMEQVFNSGAKIRHLLTGSSPSNRS